MNKYYQAIINTSGDAKALSRVQVLDNAGDIVTIYADKSGTRFTDATGANVNYCEADATGMVEFYWTAASGQTLQVLDSTGELERSIADFANNFSEPEATANVDAVLGVTASDGDLGTFTGSTIPDSSAVKPALQALETAGELTATEVDNLKPFTDLPAFKAQPVTNEAATLITVDGVKSYAWVAGSFGDTSLYPLDSLKYIVSDNVAAYLGRWVWSGIAAQEYAGAPADEFMAKQRINPVAPVAFDLHYGVLRGIGWLAAESGGIVTTTATTAIELNSATTTVADASGFVDGQLLCFIDGGGNYWTMGVHHIDGNVIYWDSNPPAIAPIGATISSFYNNDAHPNINGYKAIADALLRECRYAKETVWKRTDASAWTAFDGGFNTPITDNIYTNPGTAEFPAAQISSFAQYAGARTEYIDIPAGAYELELIVNGGVRTGTPDVNNTILVAVEETENGDTARNVIASQLVWSFDGNQRVVIPFAKSRNTKVAIMTRCQHTGPWRYAIGKVAIRKVLGEVLNFDRSKHVFLGDSWFNDGTIIARMQEKLPSATLINEGIGGNKASQMIARFGSDVVPENPDYVWLICGTNDDYFDITRQTFEQQNRQLTQLCIDNGYQPISINSSVTFKDYVPAPGARLSNSREYAITSDYGASSEIVPDNATPGIVYAKSGNSFLPLTTFTDAEEKLAFVSSEPMTGEAKIHVEVQAGGGSPNVRFGYEATLFDTALSDEVTVAIPTVGSEDRVVTRTDSDLKFLKIYVENVSGGNSGIAYSVGAQWE